MRSGDCPPRPTHVGDRKNRDDKDVTVTNLLTTTEAAAALALAPKTLRNWRSQGLGPPFIRLGGAIRYRETDLLAWVDAQAVTVGAGA